MSDPDRIPDEAFVVRCGLPPFAKSPLIDGCTRRRDGHYGFSVQSEVGLTVQELATACFNNSVGYTTVGDIRRMGYDVIRTYGEFHHATVVVPEHWGSGEAEALTKLFKVEKNSSPKRQ